MSSRCSSASMLMLLSFGYSRSALSILTALIWIKKSFRASWTRRIPRIIWNATCPPDLKSGSIIRAQKSLWRKLALLKTRISWGSLPLKRPKWPFITWIRCWVFSRATDCRYTPSLFLSFKSTYNKLRILAGEVLKNAHLLRALEARYCRALNFLGLFSKSE